MYSTQSRINAYRRKAFNVFEYTSVTQMQQYENTIHGEC